MKNMEREVLATVAKVPDIEVHTSVLHTPWGDHVDIREFVVSLSEYGRGITFPIAVAESVRKGLEAALGSA